MGSQPLHASICFEGFSRLGWCLRQATVPWRLPKSPHSTREGSSYNKLKNSPLIKHVRMPSRAEELQKSAFHNLPFFHSLCVFSCTMIVFVDLWPPPAAFFFANPPDSTGRKMRERVQISACF